MVFSLSLYLSVIIFLLGTAFRLYHWFTINIGPDADRFSPVQRFSHAILGIVRHVISRNIGRMIRLMVFDCLLQIRLFNEDLIRWMGHMLIFYGILLLALMHAFDSFVTEALFPGYASTLFPFIFLRNLFGVMVLAGAGLAVFQRSRDGTRRFLTRPPDWIAITIVSTLVISGFAVEGTQILSSSEFDRMTEDYLGSDEEDEINALRALWASEFGVRFLDDENLRNPALIEAGRLLHKESCAVCHSNPQTAFFSYSLSFVLRPIAGSLSSFHVNTWLWYLHYLTCFAGLAYLPFSKLFHLISTPVSLLIGSVEKDQALGSANRITRRALSFDACTNCGICSLHCSVAPAFQVLQNKNILPSEKLHSVKKMAEGKTAGRDFMNSLSQGSFICTACFRCTRLCPSGINLQDLWLSSKSDLINIGFPEPHIWIGKRRADEWEQDNKAILRTEDFPKRLEQSSDALTDRPEAFSSCVQCSTCTSVCPVVNSVDDARQDLDFTPQQVINLLRLDLKEIAMGTRMVWNCVTCYMCQEKCPQGIKVTDIFYELRNMACQRYRNDVSV